MMHMAVLLASGWLLMVPPIKEKTIAVKTIPEPVATGEWDVEDKQPHSKWEQERAFDKADDYELGRSRLLSEAMKNVAEIKEKWDDYEKMYQEPFEKARTRTKVNPEELRFSRFMNPRYLTALNLAKMYARCVPSDVVYPSQPKK